MEVERQKGISIGVDILWKDGKRLLIKILIICSPGVGNNDNITDNYHNNKNNNNNADSQL